MRVPIKRKTLDERIADIVRRDNANREEQRRRRGRVKSYEGDGDWIEVEFTRDNGERLIGVYKRTSWTRAPRELLWQIHNANATGYESIHWPGPAGQRLSVPEPPEPGETPLSPEPASDRPDPESQES